jgi:DNA-binding NtrC family response regulator
MKVLIVDDEHVVADSLALIFQRHRHEARAAYSAEEASELLREFQPDLLLTDVKMAKMNGIELAMKICSEIPNCRVLLMSGQPDTSNLLDEAKSRGFEFEILAKPFAPPELINKAEELTSNSNDLRS